MTKRSDDRAEPELAPSPSNLPRTRYWEFDRRRPREVDALEGEFAAILKELAPALPAIDDKAAKEKRRTAASDEARWDEISKTWQRAVGDDLAVLSRPTRFRGGVLTVEIDSAPLAAELGTFAKQHLLEALDREGLAGVCDLKFRVK